MRRKQLGERAHECIPVPGAGQKGVGGECRHHAFTDVEDLFSQRGVVRVGCRHNAGEPGTKVPREHTLRGGGVAPGEFSQVCTHCIRQPEKHLGGALFHRSHRHPRGHREEILAAWCHPLEQPLNHGRGVDSYGHDSSRRAVARDADEFILNCIGGARLRADLQHKTNAFTHIRRCPREGGKPLAVDVRNRQNAREPVKVLHITVPETGVTGKLPDVGFEPPEKAKRSERRGKGAR